MLELHTSSIDDGRCQAIRRNNHLATAMYFELLLQRTLLVRKAMGSAFWGKEIARGRGTVARICTCGCGGEARCLLGSVILDGRSLWVAFWEKSSLISMRRLFPKASYTEAPWISDELRSSAMWTMFGGTFLNSSRGSSPLNKPI